MVHRPAHVQYTAERNGLRGGGRRPRPHLEPRGVYFFLVLLDGRGGRARVPEVRACAPHPPSRARSDHTHTHAADIARLQRPPPRSHALSAPPLTTMQCPEQPNAQPALRGRSLGLRAR